MLHVASVCTPCWMMLHVVPDCWELLRKVWNRSNFYANNPQLFLLLFCGSVCTALPTLLGARTRITHGFLEHQSRVSQYWRSNSDYGINNALRVPTLLGGCSIRLHTSANTIQQLLTFFGPTMVGVVAPSIKISTGRKRSRFKITNLENGQRWCIKTKKKKQLIVRKENCIISVSNTRRQAKAHENTSYQRERDKRDSTFQPSDWTT